MNDCVISGDGEQRQKQMFVCLFGKIGNKTLVLDIRFEMPIKHPAVGYFVWSLEVLRVGRCYDFGVSDLLHQ